MIKAGTTTTYSYQSGLNVRKDITVTSTYSGYIILIDHCSNSVFNFTIDGNQIGDETHRFVGVQIQHSSDIIINGIFWDMFYHDVSIYTDNDNITLNINSVHNWGAISGCPIYCGSDNTNIVITGWVQHAEHQAIYCNAESVTVHNFIAYDTAMALDVRSSCHMIAYNVISHTTNYVAGRFGGYGAMVYSGGILEISDSAFFKCYGYGIDVYGTLVYNDIILQSQYQNIKVESGGDVTEGGLISYPYSYFIAVPAMPYMTFGYNDQEKSFILSQNLALAVGHSFELQNLNNYGSLEIYTTPIQGAIYLNGNYKGKGHIYIGNILEGSYTVSVQTYSYYDTPEPRIVNVTANTLTTITMEYFKHVTPVSPILQVPMNVIVYGSDLKIFFEPNETLEFQHLPNNLIILDIAEGNFNASVSKLQMYVNSGKLTFTSLEDSNISISSNCDANIAVNNRRVNGVYSFLAGKKYELKWNLGNEALPIGLFLGLIGLIAMIAGSLYMVKKIREGEYSKALLIGLPILLIGFGLFIGWLGS